MRKKVIFLFSGQGSQFYHMGKGLYESNAVFRKWVDQLDNSAREITGKSIIQEIYDPNISKSKEFDKTRYSHPAIFIMGYALFKLFEKDGIRPDYVIGTSLGELIAAAAAEVIDVNTALNMVIKQAEILEETCPPGGMLAILENASLYDTPVLSEFSEIAALNFDSHFVVAGRNEGLHKIQTHLKEKGIINQKLPISFAFHSSHIDPAEIHYTDYLKTVSCKTPRIPYISSMTSGFTKTFPTRFFWDVVRKPIQFQDTIHFVEAKGSYIYVDLGCSGNLASFVKNNLNQDSKSEVYPIMTNFGIEMNNYKKVHDVLKTNNQKKDKIKVFVFPGQGSQFKGMGRKLFDEFKELTEKADQILGYSIKDLCLNDTEQKLNLTQYTQAAIYMVSALNYYSHTQKTQDKPDFVAGHSLGEYNALLASGAIDFETGLKLVKKRGELMSQSSGGSMAAVLGMDEQTVRQTLSDNALDTIDVANLNTPSQIVISGRQKDIEKARPIFMDAKAHYIPLKVSAAFHSRYMQPAKNEFRDYLNQFEFSEISIPLISNVTARPYRSENIKTCLADQLVSSVKWDESIRYLMGKGECEFIELGDSNVLSGMIAKIKKESEPLYINDDLEPDGENSVTMDNPFHTLSNHEHQSSDTGTQASSSDTEKTDDVPINESRHTESFKATSSHSQPANFDKNKAVEVPLSESGHIKASLLGNPHFKTEYNLKYAYVAGGMGNGISSKELVVKMSKSGMLGYLGTHSLTLSDIEKDIFALKNELNASQPFGLNIVAGYHDHEIIDLALKHNINKIEVSSYLHIPAALVQYRLKGLREQEDGSVVCRNKIMAKISRPEIAEMFLCPPDTDIVKRLLKENKITPLEADLSKRISLASDICAQSDSAGVTDHSTAYSLVPTIIRQREELSGKYQLNNNVYIGAAGNIGTPEAAAAAFMLGADFILTGSINQCTVEANTSHLAKELLQHANIQDTEYAPSHRMFEIGAKTQVLKRGLFFPFRAQKLYDLYRNFDSFEKIDPKIQSQVQEKYFNRRFEDIFDNLKRNISAEELGLAENSPKYKMGLVFKDYLKQSFKTAVEGDENQKVNFQIYCSPAMGAFNQWVKGTPLSDWHNRRVDEIGLKILSGAEKLLFKYFHRIYPES